MAGWGAPILYEGRYEAAVRERIRANARKGKAKRWLEADPSRAELAARVRNAGYDRPGSFLGKMAESLDEWGSLTEGQEAAVRRIFAQDAERQAQRAVERAAEAAVSQHVGEVGVRMPIEAQLRWKTSFETRYGTLHVSGLKDAAGNVLIYKGQPVQAERGQWLKGVATIKEHSVREGVKQTIVSRPKWAVVAVEAAKEAA